MKRSREGEVAAAAAAAVSSLKDDRPESPPQPEEIEIMQPDITLITLSSDFTAYLNSLDIDPALLTVAARDLPRYIRINPRIAPAPTAVSLSLQLGAQLHPTAVPDVYRIAASEQLALAASIPYKQSLVYGIDLASIIAVRALSLPTSPPSAPVSAECVHVLDLCCAPGAKLAYMHDLLATARHGPFTLTGVDVSLPRLSSCRNLLHKYRCNNVTLCLADGRTFRQPPPSPQPAHTSSHRAPSTPYVIHDLIEPTEGPHRLLLTKRQKKAMRHKPSATPTSTPPTSEQSGAAPFSFTSDGYHHILVDAQCSHDGSVRHLVKQAAHAAPHLSHSRSEPACDASLPELQRALLAQAWSLLRVGGVLVYSTCSTQREQNEDVVEWLVERHGGVGGAVQLCPAFDSEDGVEVSDEDERRLLDDIRARMRETKSTEAVLTAFEDRVRWKRGLKWARLPMTQECVRLSPFVSGTSGLFIAKLRKLS